MNTFNGTLAWQMFEYFEYLLFEWGSYFDPFFRVCRCLNVYVSVLMSHISHDIYNKIDDILLCRCNTNNFQFINSAKKYSWHLFFPLCSIAPFFQLWILPIHLISSSKHLAFRSVSNSITTLTKTLDRRVWLVHVIHAIIYMRLHLSRSTYTWLLSVRLNGQWCLHSLWFKI